MEARIGSTETRGFVDEEAAHPRKFGPTYRIEITEDVLAHLREANWLLGADCVLCKAFRNAVACAEEVPASEQERGFTLDPPAAA